MPTVKQTKMADRLRADNQHLQSIAFRDSLTGRTNRALLEDRLTQEIRHAERGGRIFAVLFIDLDSFKPVNDTYGHRSGDFMLTVLADRLVGAVRGTDTVARVGGDEFVVILSELADPRDAAALCKKSAIPSRSLSCCRKGRSPFPAASGSAFILNTVRIPLPCSKTPMPRCTPPRRTTAMATDFSSRT